MTMQKCAVLLACTGAVLLGAKGAVPQSTVIEHVAGAFIALSTPDAAKTARWYQDKFGFRLVKEGEMGKDLRFALLRYDNNILELIQNPRARPLAEAVPGIKDPFEIHGIFKTGFTVDKLDEVFSLLQRNRVKIDFQITQLNDLGFRAFGVRDIDGNLIQIFGK